MLVALLSSDDLCVASEEKVLRAVLLWGLANMPTGARLYVGAEAEAERVLAGPAAPGADHALALTYTGAPPLPHEVVTNVPAVGEK